ncbi:platelet glycoprotein IX [Nothobranchius furzeri]|nr:glycoprotein IX (platelet) [Nothobranchius furzeri]KAF7210054.1 platelet glycoprotein Ib beta chain-like [Nothobranchius furzeri]
MLLSTLTLAVLFTSSSSHRTVESCIFSVIQPAGLHVNCSSLELTELPHLPADTTELYVQNNRLTSVSPGLLDRLRSLKRVSMSPNPFHCDCSIQYLRNWLLRNKAVVAEEPLCSSPSSVAQKTITELSDNYFFCCTFPLVHHVITSSCVNTIHNTTLGVVLLCLILLLVWSLNLARKATYTLCLGERHLGLEAESLRSLRPKHRRRLHSGLSEVTDDSDSLTWSEDSERPLINMDLLPQVLEVLHKKHNIKIKAS